MEKSNQNMVSGLINLISEVANKIVKMRMKNVPNEWIGKVVETSGSIAFNSFASIYLNGDTTSAPISLKNKTNETLVANQIVIIHSHTGNLSNAIILYAQ